MARTSYFTQASATATRATVAFTTAVDFANTPPANSSVLYIGSVELLGSAAGNYEVRLRDNTNSSSYAVFLDSSLIVASSEVVNMSTWGIVSYGAAPPSQSISLDVRSCAATTNLQRSNAYLWGLVLASGNDQFAISSDTFVTASSDVWVTVGTQLNVSVATSGKWLILSYAEACAASEGGTGASVMTTHFRMLTDGSASKKQSIRRQTAGANPRNYVYMNVESFTAGAHTINLQAAQGNAGAASATQISRIRRIRHAALEVSAFAYNYIQSSSEGTSGASTSFTTVKSFTPDLTETKLHAQLAYFSPAVPSTGFGSETLYSQYLRNTENISGTNIATSVQSSMAGQYNAPFLIAVQSTLTAGTFNNFSIQQKTESAGISYHLERHCIFIVQLADASVGGGGPQTTAKTVEAVGRGVASVIKTVGANRIAIGGGRAAVTKTVGATREAVTRGVADVGAHEVFSQLLSALSVNIASMATSSQFRIALESVAVAIASISSRTTRAQTLQAVTRAIAEFSSHTTRLGNFVAFARNIAETIKTVGKNIEAQGKAIAADQVGYFVRQEAVATAVAFLADATRVTASGSAVVVTANPYVLSLGDSVKRFKSLLQHGAGLGRGTTSDRDPDS